MFRMLFAFAPVLLFVSAASASDGVVLLNQHRALAGEVTPGDAPGFPITISVPGSYELSGNLDLPLGGTGIEVTADHVTLNLNGFSIIGDRHQPPLTTTQTDVVVGVEVTSRSDVTILNGTVTFAGDGIRFEAIRNGRVERLRVLANSRTGIVLNGYGVITDSTVAQNDSGIVLDNSTVETTPGLSSIRNTDILQNRETGVAVQCPNTNLIGDTIAANGKDIFSNGRGCTVFNTLISSALEEH